MYLRALAVWVVVGFAPTAVLLWLMNRWWHRPDNNSFADVNDAGKVMDWLLPAIAVLATLPLFRLHQFAAIKIAIACIIPIAVFHTVLYAARLARWRGRTAPEVYSAGQIVRRYVRNMSPVLGIAAYLCLAALIRDRSFVLKPDARLYINLILASWMGRYMLNRAKDHRDYVRGTWRLLAPCELFNRIREIASRIGGKIDTVYMISDQPFRWVGAFACGGADIALAGTLVGCLTKQEVDTVIAHEVGHTLESNYWGLYYPIAMLAWLAWFIAVLSVNTGLSRLPAAFWILRYVVWCAAFVVPALAILWYQRAKERAADRHLAVLDNPKAAISCFEKLALANDLPTDRPWWSRVISSHPTIAEDQSAVARWGDVSADEVKQIRDAARVEHEQNAGEKYEPECHIGSSPELLPRPKVSTVWGYYGFTAVLGVLAIASSLAFYEPQMGPKGLIPVFGIILGAAGVVVGFHMLAAWTAGRSWRKFRGRLSEKLNTMYPSAKDGMLLVDAYSIQDWPSSHCYGALLDISADGLVLLSEGRELRVDVGSVRRLSSRDVPAFGGTGRSMLWYEQDGVPQYLAIVAIRGSEKGLPRDSKEMELWLRERLSSAGASLDAHAADKPRFAVKKLPTAIVILAATAALACLLPEMLGYRTHSGLIGGLTTAVSAQYLWPWLWVSKPDGGSSGVV